MAKVIKGKKGFIKLNPKDKRVVRKTLFFTAKEDKLIKDNATKLDMNYIDYLRHKILAE